MGFFGWLCDVGNKAITIVKDCAVAVGRTLVNHAKEFLGIVPPERVDPVSRVIKTVAEDYQVLKPNDDLQTMGQISTTLPKTPEDFKEIKEYIDYLRSEIDAAKQEMKELVELTEEKKLAYIALGTSIASQGITEKTGIEITPELYGSIAKYNIDSKEVSSLIETFKEKNLKTMKDFTDYIGDTEGEFKNAKVGEAITEAYKVAHPKLSDKEIDEKIFELESEK